MNGLLTRPTGSGSTGGAWRRQTNLEHVMDQQENNLHDEATNVEKLEEVPETPKESQQELCPNRPKKTFCRNFFAIFGFLMLLTFMRAVILSSPQGLPTAEKEVSSSLHEEKAEQKLKPSSKKANAEKNSQEVLEKEAEKPAIEQILPKAVEENPEKKEPTIEKKMKLNVGLNGFRKREKNSSFFGCNSEWKKQIGSCFSTILQC